MAQDLFLISLKNSISAETWARAHSCKKFSATKNAQLIYQRWLGQFFKVSRTHP